MRNPNGYGSVTKLSGNRRRPFIVKKTVGWNEKGHPIYSIIGYTATREEGIMLLAEYNKDPWDVERSKITLSQLYEKWRQMKAPRLGKSSVASLASAYKHCAEFWNKPYREIKSYHMQSCIDRCGKGYATQAIIKNLWYHMDRFALELDIVTRCYSDILTTDPVPPTTRDRIDDATINRLWEHQSEPWVDSVLIFIYSGWRISELLSIKKEDVDLAEGTMKGGTKTKAGKNRIVPIHSLIRPFIENRMKEAGEYLISRDGAQCAVSSYRIIWNSLAERYDIHGTPHSCRHTFESLLDSAGANRKCIDLMMGHVSKDTGNRVYNHKTLSELKSNIELITR